MNVTADSVVPVKSFDACGQDGCSPACGGEFSPLASIFRLEIHGPLLDKVNRLTELVSGRVRKTEDQERIFGALLCMLQVHEGEKPRDDGTDGRIHPVTVAVNLMERFGVVDPSEICAAILHDTVEDRPFEFVAYFFGKERSAREFSPSEVRGIVFEALRTVYGEDTAVKIELLTYRKDRAWIKNDDGTSSFDPLRYLRYVQKIYNTDAGAFRIKLSDFEDNGFRLNDIRDQARRDELHNRYRGAMLFLRGILESSEPGHFLYPHREDLLRKIEAYMAYSPDGKQNP